MDITKRNMLTLRTTFDKYLVNRPVESVFSNKLLQKVNSTCIYIGTK